MMKGSKTEVINKSRLFAAVILLVVACALGFALYKYMDYSRYKLVYESEIKKYSAKYDIDPYLVASIIHVESGNKPSAVSSVGAIGLMQLMPETAEWICGKLDLEYSEEMLKDPETNIEFGCWYLRFIKDRISNNEAAIAAYNAGHSVVGKWLNSKEYSQNGESLDSIPYAQTASYVKKVNKALDIYRKLYAESFN